jgi:hypothetical protein
MKLRTFAIGLVWTAFGAISPLATMAVDNYFDRKPIDWHQMSRVSVFNSVAAVAAYWRKHLALLKLPPDIQEALGISGLEQGK